MENNKQQIIDTVENCNSKKWYHNNGKFFENEECLYTYYHILDMRINGIISPASPETVINNANYISDVITFKSLVTLIYEIYNCNDSDSDDYDYEIYQSMLNDDLKHYQ